MGGESERSSVSRSIWIQFLNYRVDELPLNFFDGYVDGAKFTEHLKTWFFGAEWYEIYDFIEYLVGFEQRLHDMGFAAKCNVVLKESLAGYRVVEDKIIQVTSEGEIGEIEEAIQSSDQWKPVSIHLKAALDLLTHRKNPNYRNSIKESISAVESTCKIILGDEAATLGKALSQIEKSHDLHGALKKAFQTLYGYTSDSGGIRHALISDDNHVSMEEAKFMLISCSAFINYLKSKV